MTDRELLEAAAKAAGLTYGVIHDEPRIRVDAGWTPWNPLTDDGDRYRLARTIGLRVDWHLQRVLTPAGSIYDWTTSGHGDDEAHAIVRAAAAMVKV